MQPDKGKLTSYLLRLQLITQSANQSCLLIALFKKLLFSVLNIFIGCGEIGVSSGATYVHMVNAGQNADSDIPAVVAIVD